MRTRLINLYGAPGCGKSTKMLELALAAGRRGLSCEICPEVAKEYAIRDIPMTGPIQIAISREQFRRLECFVGHTPWLFTDAPVLIGGYYGFAGNFPERDDILAMCQDFDRRLARHADSLNVFLERQHPYVPHGRYQDESEATRMHHTMLAYVRQHHDPASIVEVPSTIDPDQLLDQIAARLDK